jgi:hypothetical protein
MNCAKVHDFFHLFVIGKVLLYFWGNGIHVSLFALRRLCENSKEIVFLVDVNWRRRFLRKKSQSLTDGMEQGFQK